MLNSYQWIDAIIPKLFEAEDRYQDRLISDLNKANSEIKGKRFLGFMHMGTAFVPKDLRNQLRMNRQPLPTLDFTLINRTEELVKHFTRTQLDKSQIRQLLFKLLCQCNNLQEIRDVLPDCLLPLVPEVAGLSREHQDPLYMVRSDKYFMREYERILPKIEFYAMSRMIY